MSNSRLIPAFAVLFVIVLVVALGAAIWPSVNHTLVRPTPTQPSTNELTSTANPDPMNIGRIDSTLAIDSFPNGVLVSNNAVWTWNTHAGTVSRIDPNTGQTAAVIRIGDPQGTINRTPNGYPADVVSDGASLWAGAYQSIVQIDPQTNTIVDRISLNKAQLGGTDLGTVSGLALDGDTLWASDSQNNIVIRMDIRSKSVSTVILGVDHAGAMAVTSGALWVVDSHSNSLIRIDTKTNQVVTTIQIPGKGNGSICDMCITDVEASGETVWVPMGYGNGVARIDANTNQVTTIPFETNVFSLVVTQDSVWAIGNSSIKRDCADLPAFVARIDRISDRILGTVTVQCAAYAIATDGGDLWVGTALAPQTLVNIHPEP